MSLFSSSNRRIKKGGVRRSANPLEISARPDRERAHLFRKRFGVFIKVVALAGLSVGSVVGGRWALQHFLWENPTYALSDLRITTDGLLTRAQIVELCGLTEGENIFRLDLLKAKQALDQLPQVERVDVRRILPDRVDVRVSERQPVAWVAPSASTRLGVDSAAHLVDVRGYVMRPRKVLPEHLALPVITGVVMEDVAPGQKLPTAESLAAVELIRLTADNTRWNPRVVDVSKGYCLTVTDHRKARVTFGFDGLEDQLSKLHQLIELVEPTQKEFVSVNLMLERNIPVVFAPPPVAQSSPDSKGAKTKGAPMKVSGANLVQKIGEDARLEAAPPAPIRAVQGVTTQPSSVAEAVSGGVLEKNTNAGSDNLPAGVASAVQSPGNTKKTVVAGVPPNRTDAGGERRVNKGEEERDAHSRVPAKVAVLNAPVSGAVPVAAVPVEKSAPKSGGYSKYSKSKLTRSPARVRRVSPPVASSADRSSAQSSPSRAVRGVGPVSKGAAPAGNKPSLNPTEALRKLFSPHG